jgi:hypothetical protein
MTKHISSLVKDIYDLFENDGPDIDEQELTSNLNHFSEQLEQHIKTFLFEKRDDRKNNYLRLSGIGKPDRQVWYSINLKPEKNNNKIIEPSTKIKFLYGYILEELLLLLAKTAKHKVEDEQKELVLNGVVGHQDAVIDGILVDCKSTSGKGFEKFKYQRLNEDDPFGYIEQISAYAQANGYEEAAFLVIDKSSGEICLTPIHSLEMIDAEKRISELKKIVSTNAIPDKCYPDIPDGKSGNYKLHVGCVYCDYKRTCWSNANGGKGLRVFNYSKNKRYLTRIGREPEVEELKDW